MLSDSNSGDWGLFDLYMSPSDVRASEQLHGQVDQTLLCFRVCARHSHRENVSLYGCSMAIPGLYILVLYLAYEIHVNS